VSHEVNQCSIINNSEQNKFERILKTYFKRRLDVANPQQSSNLDQLYRRQPKCTPLSEILGPS